MNAKNIILVKNKFIGFNLSKPLLLLSDSSEDNETVLRFVAGNSFYSNSSSPLIQLKNGNIKK